MSAAGLRVLELAEGAAAPFAGRMYASLGAEVVKVELPGGDWTRRKPPLVHRDDDATGALFHFLNAGKRSVVLDHDDAEPIADDSLAALWRWSDVVLIDERFVRLSAVARLLTAAGPRVVAVVTPHGMTGPDRDLPGTAATAFARCGEGSITPGGIGYHEFPDEPYLVARGKVADIDAGVMAFLTTMATAVDGGEPPGDAAPTLIDVSAHEAAVSNNRWIASNFTRTGWIETRASKPYPFGGMMPCKDGHAMFLPSTDRIWRAFVDIMGDPEWALADELVTREGRVANADDVREQIVEWAASVTMAELLDAGLSKGVPLGPYRTIADVATCPQLTARGFFHDYGDDPGGPRLPGLPAPGWMATSAIAVAPTLGEYGSVGTPAISEEER